MSPRERSTQTGLHNGKEEYGTDSSILSPLPPSAHSGVPSRGRSPILCVPRRERQGDDAQDGWNYRDRLPGQAHGADWRTKSLAKFTDGVQAGVHRRDRTRT